MANTERTRYCLPARLGRYRAGTRRHGPLEVLGGIVTGEGDVNDTVPVRFQELLGSTASRNYKLQSPLSQQRRIAPITGRLGFPSKAEGRYEVFDDGAFVLCIKLDVLDILCRH
jgi:hypothetical protein